MDIRQQAVTEYLTEGTGYRKLAAKYGVSRERYIQKARNIPYRIHC